MEEGFCELYVRAEDMVQGRRSYGDVKVFVEILWCW